MSAATSAAAPRVLSVGECMVELAPLDRPGDYRMGFAGDTFNTAWYLRQLRPAWDVSFLTAVGRDAVSDRMVRFMEAAGIGTGHVARRDDRSVGLYLISLTDGERSFSYWRENSAARLLAEDEAALRRAVDGAGVVYFSGITLAILDLAARDRLLGVLREAREGNRTVAFDPNLRPRLWPDADGMRAAVMAAAQVSDIVLPSFEDDAAAFGDPGPEATAMRYAGAGAACVVVKNGADPVHFLRDGKAGDVAVAPAPRVVDTTSAGDSFNAGFLATQGDAMDMPARIGLASAVARGVIAGKGALVPPDLDALSSWLTAGGGL